MCGIAGFAGRIATREEWQSILTRMTDAIAHRGPDDAGLWVDTGAGVALGHRRLSILDLSAAGRQPMMSHCGRYLVSFNGEIYNFRQLREELDSMGHPSAWRGHADTEVLLEAISAWGIEGALRRMVGMFAFALWDREARTLVLARDRLGEKPLYYGMIGGALVFASELGALGAFPGWQGRIDRSALALLLRYSYIPAPYTIYEGISKLPPGHLLSIKVDTQVQQSASRPYWQMGEVIECGVDHPFTGSVEEATEELDRLLRKAIEGQMIADVPLGAFLSGGIDSSTIVALMQAQSNRPIRTFAIGFNESGFDEADYASRVARHLGTEHTELYVTAETALDLIPRLPEIYSEPFADASQIPTFLVASLARSHVTVALSGDGGDELFGGYNRYLAAERVWRRFALLPPMIRTALGNALRSPSQRFWQGAFDMAGAVLPGPPRLAEVGEKIHKLGSMLAAPTRRDAYRQLISHWLDPDAVVLQGNEPQTILDQVDRHPANNGFASEMMFLDMLSYLPDDILVKVDRAAMAVGLETRVPFLDHRLIEFAWRVPMAMKIRHGQGKWLLRRVLSRYVPAALIERPKAGLTIPLGAWLRGPLREWAEALLDEGRLCQEGYFDAEPIRRKWAEHLSGRCNWQYDLWNVLMFQAWLEKNKK